MPPRYHFSETPERSFPAALRRRLPIAAGRRRAGAARLTRAMATARKRRAVGPKTSSQPTPLDLSAGAERDDFIESDEDVPSDAGSAGSEEEEAEDANETAEERRLRLAKHYLSQLRDEEDDGGEGSDVDALGRSASATGLDDRVGERLEQRRLDASGSAQRRIAESVAGADLSGVVTQKRGHRLSVTAVCVERRGAFAFSASKDNSIVAWDVERAEKLGTVAPQWQARGPGGQRNERKAHEGEVLALAISTDGRYLASGGRDRLVRVWDVRSLSPRDGFSVPLLHTLSHHRDAVSALCFREHSEALFSGGHDRVVKHWQAASGAYVESLFGHQAPVQALDCARGERPLSAGDDRTGRMWKLVEQTHLIFKGGHTANIDCAALVNEDFFLTGAEDGAVGLFFSRKKKPALLMAEAHGLADAWPHTPHWVSSVAAVRGTDLAATGSSDGHVRLWQVDCGAESGSRDLEEVGRVPVAGFVNSLAFADGGRVLVAGVGQEHRLGRWSRIKGAKNGVCFVRLPVESAA